MADTLSRKQKKRLKDRAKKKKPPESLPGTSGSGDTPSLSSGNNHLTSAGQLLSSNTTSGGLVVEISSTNHVSDVASHPTDCFTNGDLINPSPHSSGTLPPGDPNEAMKGSQSSGNSVGAMNGRSPPEIPVDAMSNLCVMDREGGLMVPVSNTEKDNLACVNSIPAAQAPSNDALSFQTENLPAPPPVRRNQLVEAEGETAACSSPQIEYVDYVDERQLSAVMELVDRDLSEPYSIFTYRYFLHTWPNLCVCAMSEEQLVGVIICKAETESGTGGDEVYRGYIAMLAVNDKFRKLGIGGRLVRLATERMRSLSCDEVMLETEVTNTSALRLYEKLGFTRDERLLKYYLNGIDAFRLRLWFH